MARPDRLALLVVAALAAPPAALADSMAPVIELYTSQGCSSCPAADRLLSDYARTPGHVALTFPVDYWDYLGWRDTLARPAHAARQKAYSEMRGDRRVFTPQAVINGRAHAAGHDRPAIERAIGATRVDSPVALTARRLGDELEISVPASRAGQMRMAEVWALGVAGRVGVEITRGENSGRTIEYHNVVRSMVKVADWSGATLTLRRPLAALADGDADILVVLVQGGHAERPGPIVGVATVPLH